MHRAFGSFEVFTEATFCVEGASVCVYTFSLKYGLKCGLPLQQVVKSQETDDSSRTTCS